MKETVCQHTFWPNFLISLLKEKAMFASQEQKMTFVDTLVQKACKIHVAIIREACEGRIPYELYLYAEVNKQRAVLGVLKNQRYIAGKEK